MALLIYTPTYSEMGCLFLYILSNICCQDFDDGHSDWDEVVCQSSFILCLSNG